MASAAGNIDVFQPSRFESLYGIIHAVATTPDAATPNWYLDVERQRDALATLGRIRPKNDAERRDMNKGM